MPVADPEVPAPSEPVASIEKLDSADAAAGDKASSRFSQFMFDHAAILNICRKYIQLFLDKTFMDAQSYFSAKVGNDGLKFLEELLTKRQTDRNANADPSSKLLSLTWHPGRPGYDASTQKYNGIVFFKIARRRANMGVPHSRYGEDGVANTDVAIVPHRVYDCDSMSVLLDWSAAFACKRGRPIDCA
jgi:hypothetical protein